MSRQFSDRYGTVTEYVHFPDDETFVIEEVEDAAPAVAAAETHADTSGDWYRLEAVVPATVLSQALREGWMHDKAAWRRWLNDPDNRRFRVEHQGRVRAV